MNTTDETLSLVHEYLRLVSRAVDELRGATSFVDLLAAWKSRKVPQHGTTPSGAAFHFHGIGCRVEFKDVCVDFDFGPDGRHDGFDTWRLYEFAHQRPESYPHVQTFEETKRAVEELMLEGKAHRPGWLPGRNLLYLSSSTRREA
jgi:hypothetical protein